MVAPAYQSSAVHAVLGGWCFDTYADNFVVVVVAAVVGTGYRAAVVGTG